MNSNRPKNLALNTIELPLTAKASILHRISGFALFFAVAFVLCALNMSLKSEASFNEVKEMMTSPLAQLITFGILAAFSYHFVAGIKHLVMDMGIGETKEGGRLGALITFISAFVLIALAGVWVWA